MPLSPDFRPAKAHAALGPDFYDLVVAADFPKHIIRHRNQRWAARVGCADLTDEEWIAHFGRFEPLPGSFEQPMALRYHGHQFRHYNPDLGDGRGFLFAQLYDRVDGRLLDLGTKGSGQTPWSRTADGRLTLKGGVREVLATEMLEALGVNTSKSFSLIETGEDLVRGDEPSPTRSSVLVRLNHSHIRIGTFQRLRYLQEDANIGRLLDYAVTTYMPSLWRDDVEARTIAFLEEVCRRVGVMGAQWMLAGFVHGVLNTDNINITGESFDYGPWRFLPVLDPRFTAAYFDETGLYAYGAQPDALLWNLARLAECLLPLASQEALEKALEAFRPAFHETFLGALLRRLGIVSQGDEKDTALARVIWPFLQKTRMPFERFFFDWYGGPAAAVRAEAGPMASFYAQEDFAAVRADLMKRQTAAGAKIDHAYFARPAPCTMLIEEVEAIWAPIATADDWSLFHAKLAAIDEMAEAYGVR
ncbi:MAG: selenoprotein O [Rhizobiales bacterium 62-17]|nr:YdiU family protein [Hyphomicrobiales bacterium]OJY00150.1 MAG: selenoprotein O [Rhizobiales bacterium 62-17]